MRLLYFFDDKVKPLIMRGKYYCKPEGTGKLNEGISCIREYDVNLWFYTKNGKTIAFDSGHINFDNINEEFKKIDVIPEEVNHLFLTHLDTDHAGGIDKYGNNIFPNAQVYMGVDENKYMKHEIRRKGMFYNCVNIADGWTPIKKNQIFEVDGIKVEAISVPGHTVGHTVYVVDDKILISGDCIAINENGGYAFFDFFTQNPKRNKESLLKLKKLLENRKLLYICTGHSGIHDYSEKIFAHIDESAEFGKTTPFHSNGEYNPFTKTVKPDYKNWMPESMLKKLYFGTVVMLILFITLGFSNLIQNGTLRLICSIILGVLTIILTFFTIWSTVLYRAFDYKGKRKLAKIIIEGIADYVKIPDGGEGLDVGCGSGALCIACAKKNPKASMVGCDIWSGAYKAVFSKELCTDNAKAEGISNVRFENGNAIKLPFEDESFDAVTSNYVYHNIVGYNKQKLLRETLRVLKKGGIFAIHDLMKKPSYGDMYKFVETLKAEGYSDVKLLDTTTGKFMSHKEAMLLGLSGLTLLVGKK
ncbi:MAG: methyltransferase domain-containing protein [Eubacteriales bacterium]|nr:methyltransferase domain-containing protein [Eubacteriales bacterium]